MAATVARATALSLSAFKVNRLIRPPPTVVQLTTAAAIITPKFTPRKVCISLSGNMNSGRGRGRFLEKAK